MGPANTHYRTDGLVAFAADGTDGIQVRAAARAAAYGLRERSACPGLVRRDDLEGTLPRCATLAGTEDCG